MADTKISALTAVVTPAITDEFAVNQGLVSKKITLAQIREVSESLISANADPADAGVIRLGNNEVIGWELAIPGTDGTLKLNTTDLFELSLGLTIPIGGLLLDSGGAFGTGTGISFGDGDTEIYESSDDVLVFAFPTETWSLNAAQLFGVITGDVTINLNGTLALPTYSFRGDNSGMYRIGSGNLGFSLSGVKFFELGGSQTALFQDTTVTTGVTTLIIEDGAGQSATRSLEFHFIGANYHAGFSSQGKKWESNVTLGLEIAPNRNGAGGDDLTLAPLNNRTNSSGDVNTFRVNGNFLPTSGTATWAILQLNPVINQTGGASGITRGIYVNPTLTAAADFRAIEVALGKSVFQEVEIDGNLNHDGSNVGFYGTAPVAQPVSAADLTNSVTAGGTNDTIDDWTDLSTYATDAAAIRNAVHQLARKLKQVNDGLRDLGLLT